MVTLNDFVLLLHATLGVLGLLCAFWVFCETLQVSEANIKRIRGVAVAGAVFMGLAWSAGGFWYIHYYPADKGLILKGPWPFAHTVFMETKEHLFFLTLILSFYLPLACRDPLYLHQTARRMVLWVSLLVFLTGMGLEGAGAIINHGAEVALRHR
jgi:hypothetical protein